MKATKSMEMETAILKRGFCEMLKKGVIVDVKNVKQAKIAEQCGAVGVMVSEECDGNVQDDEHVIKRCSNLKKIENIIKSVSVIVMGKVRVGHFIEAKILEKMNIDMIDESEMLTVADEFNYIKKGKFKTPFICSYETLEEALTRISEGASMMKTKGEIKKGKAANGIKSITKTVTHARTLNDGIQYLCSLDEKKVEEYGRNSKTALNLLLLTKNLGKLPVVNFAHGGIITPQDAALCMHLGVDGVFVDSFVFQKKNPHKVISSIVHAVSSFNKMKVLASVTLDNAEDSYDEDSDSQDDTINTAKKS